LDRRRIIPIYSKEELLNIMRKKMEEGWILVLDTTLMKPGYAISGMEILEKTIYPPGTPENKNFEAIIGPGACGPLVAMALAKITDKFKEIHSYMPDIEDTIGVIIHGYRETPDGKCQMIQEQLFRKPDRPFDEAVNDLLGIIGKELLI